MIDKSLMITKKRQAVLTTVLFILAVVLAASLAVSCDQASLFAQISDEVKPKKPRIPGSQTNIVIADNHLYVAGVGSKQIHRYKSGSWITIDGPGKVIALASTGTDLYVLAGSDVMNTSLYKRDGGGWGSPISMGDASGYSLQSIYGAGTNLFVGGRNGNTNKVFYSTGGSALADTGISGELRGAAGSYIAAGAGGIFTGSGSSYTNVYSGGNVTGIIEAGTDIIAVTWRGDVLKLDAGTFKTETTGPDFTGAMAIWNADGSTTWVNGSSLLLLGVHSSGRFEKGYRELHLPGGSLAVPGTTGLSSIGTGGKPQFDASIARNSVYSIMQVPDSVEAPGGRQPVILATTLNGLHSLRNGEWNAEE